MANSGKTTKRSIVLKRDLELPSPLPEDGLGARVETKRVEMGLTHDGLSELTKAVDRESRGISRTSIRGYELGTYRPGAREMRILCAALKVSPNWLLLGSEEDTGKSMARPDRSQAASRFRWADFVMPLLSFSQLPASERKQLRELIETMYRLQIGEVRFHKAKVFVTDFVDTVQDVVEDAKEQGQVNPEFMRKVLLDTPARQTLAQASKGSGNPAAIDM